jgi:hypothetical protein
VQNHAIVAIVAIGLCASLAERAAATEGFLYDGHTFTIIIQNPNPNSETTPWDINSSGQIVVLVDNNSFLYYGGNYNTIRVPGSDFTGTFAE